MKLELLTKALQHYVLSADCTEANRQLVFDAISECNQLAEHYDDRELWKDECSIVPLSSIIDMLNQVTYNDYGKLAKQHDNNVPFSQYTAEARKYAAFEQFTNAQLEIGYHFLSDLWYDNESFGENNPDGTFNNN